LLVVGDKEVNMPKTSDLPTRRHFIEASMAGTLSLCVSTCSSAAEEKIKPKPNVVLILLDDLGYGDLSSYGSTDLQTPNIDRLVHGGIRFNQFYANSPVCSPTRASILSGRYPDRVGVPGVIRTHREDNWGQLASDAILLPQVLKPAGYHTAIIGKWHLGLESPNTPIDRGFDHFHGFLGDMMDDYYTHRRNNINYMRLDKQEIDPKGHATELFTEWACAYIRERSTKKQPFFMYLAYNTPHTPIQPPDEWLQRVREREHGIRSDRAKLVALIEHVDDGIGKVMKSLEETGVWEDTLVIFVSDNGGQTSAAASNGPLHGGKEDMFEGGIRVPMCAVWPGHIRAKMVSNQVAMTMDLFPTICEVAETKIRHAIDGQSIFPTLLGLNNPPSERTVFWVRREGGARYGGRDYYAARRGPWKLLQNTAFEPMRLYNLDDDPEEKHPIDAAHPMYNDLFRALQEHITESGTVPWQRPKS
jgi:arylsulfatase A-like enzyme